MENSKFLSQLEVSQENLMSHVQNISKWERLSGSEEELHAFDYIKQYLSDLGAKVTLIKHDAFISLPNDSCLEIGDEVFACRGLSMSPSTPECGLTGEIVYCSDRLQSKDNKNNYLGLFTNINSLNDFKKSDIYGKIVLMDGRASGVPVAKAQALGASGVIFISGKHIHEMCISNIWGSPSVRNVDQLPKIPAITVDNATGEIIKKKIAEGNNLAVLKTSVTSEWRRIPLLIADIKAVKTSDKFVMFSGHVDSWYYGATDNAAANSVMMEVGRLAFQHKDKMERNLRLVFYSGHSHGRYAGSSWYADNYWEELHDHCFINIDLDVLGFKGADFIASAVMPEAASVVSDAVEKIANKTFTVRRYNRFADQSYWGVGITAALASFSRVKLQPDSKDIELGWWWHTPYDTVDKIDPHNLLRDGRILSVIVMRFCTSPIIPLDFRASINEIESSLENWQKQASDLFDLTVPISRAETLKQQINALYDTLPLLADEDIRSFNCKLLQLEHLLVPLNYTQGKLYENDPAVPQSPIPSLSCIKDLAENDNESTRKFILTELIRRRNYVSYTLKKAIELTAK